MKEIRCRRGARRLSAKRTEGAIKEDHVKTRDGSNRLERPGNHQKAREGHERGPAEEKRRKKGQTQWRAKEAGEF